MFDLDGTLIDTAPEITDAVNALLAEMNAPPADEALVRSWIGHGTRELLLQAVAHARGIDADALRAHLAIEPLLAALRPHCERHSGTRSRIYPAVEHTLVRLRARAVRLAVVTDQEMAFARVVLDAHQLGGRFDLVIAGDSLPARKPDPLPVQHCLDVFGMAAHRALLVGDSAIDIATARAAGVRIWAVPYGYNGGRPIVEARPDRVIPNVGAVAAAIETARLRVA